MLSGAAQGILSTAIVLPMASVVRAPGVQGRLGLHWWLIVTFVPLACVAMACLGRVLGTSFEPRNIGLMFSLIIVPITFLGGTYYSWTKLAPVTVGGPQRAAFMTLGLRNFRRRVFPGAPVISRPACRHRATTPTA